jgi:alkylhydroperoxidase/carboxymuconolactone decarboxylase family protein YurZ
MDQDVIATHLENLDRRLAKVEQILPTLATKDELKTLATRDELQAAIAPLATKEELRTAIADAIAPLATKAELQAAIAPLATKADLGELRRHMNVLNESLRGDIHLIAAHVASARSKGTEP